MLTLSPQGRAVAAVVLAFMLLTGSLNRIVFSVIGVFGDSFPDGRGGVVLVCLMLGALTLAVLVFAQSAAATEGWAGSLAQAGVVLALVHLLIVAITLLAGLVQGEDGFAIGFYGNFIGLLRGGDF